MIPAEPPPFLHLTRRNTDCTWSVSLTIKHQYDGVGSKVEMKLTFSGQESPDRGLEHIKADDVKPVSLYLMMRSCANFLQAEKLFYLFLGQLRPCFFVG